MSLRFLFISGFLFLLLAGCSGGGGGGSDSSFVEAAGDTRIVAGFVEDGPVAGARVYLLDPTTGEAARRCWASGQGRCETITDDQGHFTLYLAQDADPVDYQLVSEGGYDHLTGVGFEEFSLRFTAPLAAFQSDLKATTLSPLTSLLNRLVQSGRSLNWSRDRLTFWAGLNSADLLLKQPSRSLPVLKRTLVLVALVLQLQENAVNDPWDALRSHIAGGQPLFSRTGLLDPAELQIAFALSGEQSDQLSDLAGQLQDLSGSDVDSQQLNRYLISRLLGPELDAFLSASDLTFDATDADYLLNREILFSLMSDAAGSAIPLWGWTPQKILQHVLLKYELTNFAAFQVSGPGLFAADLIRTEAGQTIALVNDSRIADIAAGHPPYLVSHALADDERLQSGDNLARVRYYFNSNISHLLRADDLARGVLDDQLNDELLVELVEGTAANGMVKGWVSDDLFPTDLDQLIETRIFGSEFRGRAYVGLARAAIRLELYSEALTALASAEHYFDKVLSAKGTAFFSDTDARNFRELAVEYMHAGDLSAAFRVLQFLHSSIAIPIDTPLVFNNAFVAGMGLFDDAMALGNFSFAGMVVDNLRQIALGTPVDFSSSGIASYRTRVIHLVETARRYAVLGEDQNALDLYGGPGMVAELRVSDGLLSGDGTYKNKTGSYTAAWMDEMAEALHQAGDVSGAFTLLDSLTATSRAKGYKVLTAAVAMREAAAGGLLPVHSLEPAVENMNALDLIFYRVPTDTFNPTLVEAQIDALTYFVANRSAAYVALTLIENGFDFDAAQALYQAVDLVRTLDDNLTKPYNLGHSKIDFGFAKIADLFIDIGMDQAALSLLREAETQVLPYMTDAGLINKSLAKMADVYLRLGDAVAANTLLAQASQTFSLDSYDVLITALLRTQSAQTRQIVDEYVALIEDLYVPTAMTDSELFQIIKHLVQAAEYYSAIGRQQAALNTLAKVRKPAMEITSPADRVDKLINWAEGYAKIDEFSKALDTVRTIEGEGFSVSRNKAFLAIGKIYAGRNDFSNDFGSSFVTARVDLDKDGQPDFFNPLATVAEILESGLTMDDDIDGDGVLDYQDARPMYYDSTQ